MNPGKPLKVLFVVGSYPPAFCGVGEYTANLRRALAKEGVEARVAALEGQPDFRYSNREDLAQAVHNFEPVLVHLQYPGRAFGASLLPLSFATLGVPPVLTLHEFRLSHPLRKAFSARLVRAARAVVVPSETEWAALPSLVRWRRPHEIIPAGPSFEPAEPPAVQPALRFVFLGFLNKSKNLKLWLDVLVKLRDSDLPKPFVVFTGTPMDTEEMVDFRAGLRSHGVDRVVEIRSQRPASEISKFLTDGAVGFLPFRDGATSRRTSLLTLLAHGAPVIVPPPVERGLSADGGMVTAATSDAVLAAMREFGSPSYFVKQREAALTLAARFSWVEIARRHRVFYNQCVRV